MKQLHLAFLLTFLMSMQSWAQPMDPFEAKFEHDKHALKHHHGYHYRFNGIGQTALSLYQILISSQLNSSCLYSTSCSRYSRKAITKYGIVKGALLTGDRLTRCNRFILKHVPDYKVNAAFMLVDEP